LTGETLPRPTPPDQVGRGRDWEPAQEFTVTCCSSRDVQLRLPHLPQGHTGFTGYFHDFFYLAREPGERGSRIRVGWGTHGDPSKMVYRVRAVPPTSKPDPPTQEGSMEETNTQDLPAGTGDTHRLDAQTYEGAGPRNFVRFAVGPTGLASPRLEE